MRSRAQLPQPEAGCASLYPGDSAAFLWSLAVILRILPISSVFLCLIILREGTRFCIFEKYVEFMGGHLVQNIHSNSAMSAKLVCQNTELVIHEIAQRGAPASLDTHGLCIHSRFCGIYLV